MGVERKQRAGCGKASECALARGFVKSSLSFRFVRSLSNGLGKACKARVMEVGKVTTAADERTRRVRLYVREDCLGLTRCVSVGTGRAGEIC
jgi:hypothetical protein